MRAQPIRSAGAPAAADHPVLQTRDALVVCVVCGHQETRSAGREPGDLSRLRLHRLAEPSRRPAGAAMMTAVTTVASGTSRDAGELEREILTRIARAGLHICETELRSQLRSHGQPDLFGLLADLEQEGFIESETHYRLTAKGAARVPAGARPGPRSISSIPWRTHSDRLKGAYAPPIDGLSDAAERPLTARRIRNKRTPSSRPTRTKRPATTDAQLRTPAHS